MSDSVSRPSRPGFFGFLRALFRRANPETLAETGSVYSVQAPSESVRTLVVRGDQPRVTQFLFDTIPAEGGMGVVLVEYRDNHADEWLTADTSRGRVQEALMRVRDLLGRGFLDLAVFSETEGIEIFLDRWGVLEIRTGFWHESQLVAQLERLGFELRGTVSTLPPALEPLLELSPDQSARVDAVKTLLGLHPESPESTASGS